MRSMGSRPSVNDGGPGRGGRSSRSIPARLRRLLIALGLLAALTGPGAEAAFSQASPVEVNAANLAWDFAVDEEAAVEKYRDKKIILSGWVSTIRFLNGHPVLEFGGVARYREERHRFSSLKTHTDRKTKEILQRVRYESVVYYLDPDRTDIIEGAVASMVDFRSAYPWAGGDYYVEIDGHQVPAANRDLPGFTVECELKVSPLGVYDQDQRPGTCRMD